MGLSSPSPKGHSPQFLAHICCGQMAGWIKMPLGRELGLGPSNIVRQGTSSPPRKRGQSPQFLAHIYCCQMAGEIKMPLGVKADLGPGHIVLHGDPAHHPPKRNIVPQFSAHVYCGQVVAHCSYCWALVIKFAVKRWRCFAVKKNITRMSANAQLDSHPHGAVATMTVSSSDSLTPKTHP